MPFAVAAVDVIGDPEALGLDALFPAFFLALLVEGELRPGRPALAAGLGAVIALALIPFTAAGLPIIAASVAALIGLAAGRGSEGKEAAADGSGETGPAP